MKKINKGITLLVIPFLLASCSNKQPSVDVEDARRIAGIIAGKISTSTSPYEVPDSYKIVSEIKEREYEKKNGNKVESKGCIKTTLLYSQAKNVFYKETSFYLLSNGEEEKRLERMWLVVEKDKVCDYYVSDYGGKTNYNYGELEGVDYIKSYARETFKISNDSLISVLEFFRFSTTAPDSQSYPSNAVNTYEYYYGSKNEESIQIKEKTIVEVDDFVDEKGIHNFGKQTSENQIVIEDCIMKSAAINVSLAGGLVDKSEEYGQYANTRYSYSKFTSVPKLDKKLWNSVKNK